MPFTNFIITLQCLVYHVCMFVTNKICGDCCCLKKIIVITFHDCMIFFPFDLNLEFSKKISLQIYKITGTCLQRKNQHLHFYLLNIHIYYIMRLLVLPSSFLIYLLHFFFLSFIYLCVLAYHHVIFIRSMFKFVTKRSGDLFFFLFNNNNFYLVCKYRVRELVCLFYIIMKINKLSWNNK